MCAAASCSIFATVDVAVPEPEAVQLSLPHANPLGQHPPPSDAAQLNQPVAQGLLVVAASPVGTATVTPLLSTTVTDEVGGQEVVSQSLPVRQQPP